MLVTKNKKAKLGVFVSFKDLVSTQLYHSISLLNVPKHSLATEFVGACLIGCYLVMS